MAIECRPTAEQVAWIFEKLYDHLQQGGSFRYLIYTRLGFRPHDYGMLLKAGGMAISNAFSDLRDFQNSGNAENQK